MYIICRYCSIVAEQTSIRHDNDLCAYKGHGCVNSRAVRLSTDNCGETLCYYRTRIDLIIPSSAKAIIALIKV